MVNLIETIKGQFKLDLNGDHGIAHWERVKQTGNYLAQGTDADVEIINLFAYLHDSQRENDEHDPEHGLRAVKFIENLQKQGELSLNEKELKQLTTACQFHLHPEAQNDDLTIQICWDADRLDLYRVGIIPRKEFLNTEQAKRWLLTRSLDKI